MWYEENSDLLEDVKNSINGINQDLKLQFRAGRYCIFGEWKVELEGTIVESYNIKNLMMIKPL